MQSTPPPAPPRLTLPRGSRVRRHTDVRRAFDRGRSGACGPVVAYGFDRGDDAPPRYALVVGKRWGGAVARNRIRRMLRESFRLERAGLPRGFDFVLLPRDPVMPRGVAELRHDVIAATSAAARRFRREGPATPRPRTGKRRR